MMKLNDDEYYTIFKEFMLYINMLRSSFISNRLLRTGKCALTQLYAVFRDGHTPARQFLLTTLQSPVMNVLQEDDFFLDIDPDKAMER